MCANSADLQQKLTRQLTISSRREFEISINAMPSQTRSLGLRLLSLRRVAGNEMKSDVEERERNCASPFLLAYMNNQNTMLSIRTVGCWAHRANQMSFSRVGARVASRSRTEVVVASE